MALDLNTASNADTPIPAGQVVAVKLSLEPGYGTSIADATMSRSSDAVFAVLKTTVVYPPAYAGRTIWERPGLIGKGGSLDSYYATNGRYRLRRFVESGRNVEHDDMSEAAMAKRRINGLADLHGMTTIVRIEHETDPKGTTRMVIGEVLTPSDYPGYQDVANAMNGDARPSPLGDDAVPH